MMGPRITLREHSRLRIGEFDAGNAVVTRAQAMQLAGLKAQYGVDIFKWVNHDALAAQQYVGVIQLDRIAIEILPKIDGTNASASDASVRRNLAAMLMVALELDIAEGDVAHIATQQHGILEILIRLFIDKLFAQLRRGMVRRYEGQEGNLAVLRGRLAIGEQLRLNAANPERLYCRYEEFHEDNPLNRILKAAVRLLLHVSKDAANQRHLSELLFAFDDVANVAMVSLPWSKVSFDRLNEHYRPAFRLAELFLRRTPPDVTSGRAAGFSLLFDMNRLFEEYIGRVLARAFRSGGVDVRRQGPQRFLAWDEINGRHAFGMRPDVVGLVDGRPAWIIDTKWKQLSLEESREGARQGDLYQMYAYANNYDCTNVVLLYPHHAALGKKAGIRASYRLETMIRNGSSDSKGRIAVATIDLCDLRTVPQQLRLLLQESRAEERFAGDVVEAH